ncbi:MAG: RNA 2',3'-cyclic phosphodiesterase [Alphaproteobacteria bacterium]|nr:RNA 2',3'-cyclic phosphodiesterase [Alphaproteobacteria bacterium]
MIRLFVGLDLPADVRQRLTALNGGIPGARWITPVNYHLTIRFIGEVDEARAEEIDDALATVRASEFDLRLDGVGVFGHGRKIHTLWAGTESEAPLSTLHDKVDRALIRIGVAPDRRKFMPHITLARLKSAHTSRVEEYRAAHALFATEPFAVDHFVLFSSLLSKSGAIYRGEATYPLDAD